MPGLPTFLAQLAERGGRGAVVSAGFRAAIDEFWRREALPVLDVFASDLVSSEREEPPHRIRFNRAFGDCPRCGPGGCKAAVLRALRLPGDTILVFGDGAADLCMAREAHLTFARGHLAERCAAEGLPWRPLADYGTVWDRVDEWLSRPSERDAGRPTGF
jgi:2-hydroxy-3-keto-5-methylthiopentenyl-1-phosphate phosphatase